MSTHTATVSNRLRTARGHLDAVVRMVEEEAYCPDILKQLTAVQGLLEGSARLVFRHHLETCVAKAMQEGRTEEIVDELMETLKFDKRLLRPDETPSEERLAADAAEPGPDPTATPDPDPTQEHRP
jgi:DNA-binding FrmR family transcriptional regulator